MVCDERTDRDRDGEIEREREETRQRETFINRGDRERGGTRRETMKAGKRERERMETEDTAECNVPRLRLIYARDRSEASL